MYILLATTTSQIDSDVYRTIIVVSMILISMKFFLIVFQRFLDYRLKKQMIEKGISEDVAATILFTDPQMIQRQGLKWVILLLTASFGIFIVDRVQPLGLHSIGIMLASIAIGYMAYLTALRALDSSSNKNQL